MWFIAKKKSTQIAQSVLSLQTTKIQNKQTVNFHCKLFRLHNIIPQNLKNMVGGRGHAFVVLKPIGTVGSTFSRSSVGKGDSERGYGEEAVYSIEK